MFRLMPKLIFPIILTKFELEIHINYSKENKREKKWK